MLDDFRHLQKHDDGFQFVPSDLAIVMLIVGTVIGYVLGAFGRIAS